MNTARMQTWIRGAWAELRGFFSRQAATLRDIRKNGLNPRQRRVVKVFTVLGIAGLALCILIATLIGALVSNPDRFMTFVHDNFALSVVVYALINTLQIISGLVPGEPLELMAGYLFGVWGGLLVVSAGIALGEVIVFITVKKYGVRLVNLLFKKERLDDLKFFQDRRRLNMIVFLLILIPGTPKNIVVYFVGLTPMTLSTWMLICIPARILSILCSTIIGAQAAADEWGLAVAFFAATMVISVFGLLYYLEITRQAKASAVLDEVARKEWEASGCTSNDADSTMHRTEAVRFTQSTMPGISKTTIHKEQ